MKEGFQKNKVYREYIFFMFSNKNNSKIFLPQMVLYLSRSEIEMCLLFYKIWKFYGFCVVWKCEAQLQRNVVENSWKMLILRFGIWFKILTVNRPISSLSGMIFFNLNGNIYRILQKKYAVDGLQLTYVFWNVLYLCIFCKGSLVSVSLSFLPTYLEICSRKYLH